MTSERARAYGRIMTALSDLGPSKFHSDEADAVRESADVLLFADGPADDEAATSAIERVGELLTGMVESERITDERAEGLLADLEACGPAVAAAV